MKKGRLLVFGGDSSTRTASQMQLRCLFVTWVPRKVQGEGDRIRTNRVKDCIPLNAVFIRPGTLYPPCFEFVALSQMLSSVPLSCLRPARGAQTARSGSSTNDQ